MGIIVILFSLGIVCFGLTYGLINFLEFYRYSEITSPEDADNKYVRKIIVKMGVSLFAILSGIVLFFYGLFI